MSITIAVETRTWPMREPFAISRGVQTSVNTLVVTLTDRHANVGRGEACGIDYAGETLTSMREQLNQASNKIENGVSRQELCEAMPAGGARCAVDNALWDLEAKSTGTSVFKLAGIPKPRRVTSAFTIGIRNLQSYEET